MATALATKSAERALSLDSKTGMLVISSTNG
jgi:hypothetical protein